MDADLGGMRCPMCAGELMEDGQCSQCSWIEDIYDRGVDSDEEDGHSSTVYQHQKWAWLPGAAEEYKELKVCSREIASLDERHLARGPRDSAEPRFAHDSRATDELKYMDKMRLTDEASYTAQHRRTDELHEKATGPRSSADLTYVQSTPDIDIKSEPDTSASLPTFSPSKGRYYCPMLGCTSRGSILQKSFASESGRRRHISVAHSDHPRLYGCPFGTCHRNGPNGFKREDQLLAHRRTYHAEDIPKKSRPGRMAGQSDA